MSLVKVLHRTCGLPVRSAPLVSYQGEGSGFCRSVDNPLANFHYSHLRNSSPNLREFTLLTAGKPLEMADFTGKPQGNDCCLAMAGRFQVATFGGEGRTSNN